MIHRMIRDEHYILDLCDELLGRVAVRQHRFDFLVGDPDRRGRCRRLPVDAYYSALPLVIEYRERQHVEPVPFMDGRPTISGCTRGVQRRRYDQRRRDVLQGRSIALVELDVAMFAHNGRKRLRRDREADILVLREKLARFL